MVDIFNNRPLEGFSTSESVMMDSTESPTYTDTIEDALLEARSLLESIVANRQKSSMTNSLLHEVGPQRDDLLSTARSLVESANQSVSCVLSTTASAYSLTGQTIRALAKLVNPPTDVRILCNHEALIKEDWEEVENYHKAPLNIRLADQRLNDMLIVDDRAALLPSHFAGCPEAPALIVRSPVLIITIKALFARAWRFSASPDDYLRARVRLHATVLKDVVQLLSVGVKDEIAADELDVSVRTYRRYVAKVMRALGATSRFQAGARAAHLLLLAPPKENV